MPVSRLGFSIIQTQGVISLGAVAADPASFMGLAGYAIADFELRYPRAHFHDFPRPLMAQNERILRRPSLGQMGPIHDFRICPTDRHCLDSA
jgi:hypothetical protein